METVNNFLEKNICNYLIEYINKNKTKKHGKTNVLSMDKAAAMEGIIDFKLILANLNYLVKKYSPKTFINYSQIVKWPKGSSQNSHFDFDQHSHTSILYLNDDYEGGEFRFFGGKVKLNLSAGEAMLFPAEPIWIHGTEPVTKGARYAINCFLKQ